MPSRRRTRRPAPGATTGEGGTDGARPDQLNGATHPGTRPALAARRAGQGGPCVWRLGPRVRRHRLRRLGRATRAAARSRECCSRGWPPCCAPTRRPRPRRRRPHRRRRARDGAGVPPGRPAGGLARPARSLVAAAAQRRSCAAEGRPARRRPGARAAPAPEGFDARFAAVHRRYAYRLCDDPAGVPPLRRRDVVAWPRPARPGRHGRGGRGARRPARLRARSAGAARAPRRSAPCSGSGWSRDADGFVVARVVADAFCHSMVRALVGRVTAVGDGRRPGRLAGAGARRRRPGPGVAVAPAHGPGARARAYPPDADLR
jgi:hypothetical protein